MFMVSIDYTVKETKQFDGGRDNSAVYTKIAQKIIKLITRPFTSENLYVYDTVHILRTGAVVIHCTHRLHQIRLHLTSFIAACSFTAEELGVSEQLQWWRDANLFVSTLQRWSPVFFFLFSSKWESKHLDETLEVYGEQSCSHLRWKSFLWWTDGALHRLGSSWTSWLFLTLQALVTISVIWIGILFGDNENCFMLQTLAGGIRCQD